METSPLAQQTTRDFSTISPSAYSLLLIKGLTAIPYAREAAEILLRSRPDIAEAVQSRVSNPEKRPPLFWARLMHFENRYWSINQLMDELPITNILELSSGFSFRGLDLSRSKPVFYIDTDLPQVIATKQQFVDAFTADPTGAIPGNAADLTGKNPGVATPSPEKPPTAGHYTLHPLDALDPAAFDDIINQFPPGELLILNEGLLMYLTQPEKEQLAGNIHKALKTRGGYWITGDIYIQKQLDPTLIDREDSFSQFLQQHNIEEKKFPDFESATEFFTRMGFIIDREAITDVTKLTTWPRLLQEITPDLQKRLWHTPKLHATWRLKTK